MRCSNYPPPEPRRKPCGQRAAVWLRAPDGKRVPGGALCQECADRITAEYREKLEEEWPLEPLTPEELALP